MYLIYTIPVWPVHQGEILNRGGWTEVRFSPLQHHLFCGRVSVRLCTPVMCVRVSVSRVSTCTECVRAKEKIEISHPIPEPYSRLSGSCASQFEWEDGSCTQQMLCVY